MSDFKPARMRDGSLYSGHKLFLGNGLQRSCGKCGQFRQPSEMKAKPPYGMSCFPSCKPKDQA